MFTRTLRALTILGATSLVVVGCSDDKARTTEPDPSAAMVPADMLGSPANLRHQAHPLGDLVLWDTPADATSDDVIAYRVYQYAPDPTRTDAYVLVGSVDRNRIIIDDVLAGPDCAIRVRGVNADGIEGDWSEEIHFLASGPVSAPDSGPRPGMEQNNPDAFPPVGNTY